MSEILTINFLVLKMFQMNTEKDFHYKVFISYKVFIEGFLGEKSKNFFLLIIANFEKDNFDKFRDFNHTLSSVLLFLYSHKKLSVS